MGRLFGLVFAFVPSALALALASAFYFCARVFGGTDCLDDYDNLESAEPSYLTDFLDPVDFTDSSGIFVSPHLIILQT